MRDESSTLWLESLGADHGEAGERLRRSYLSMRSNATVLLNELSHSTPHFTVHDISHVDALWETASMLCGSSVHLTPAEAYVLGCAFILHDAAMGATSYQESIPSALGMAKWHDLLSSFVVAKTGEWPTAEQLACPDREVESACTVHAIRELHAAHAEKLVEQAWTTSSGNELYLIEDLQLREWYGTLIGELAASHWWSVDRLEDHFRHERNSLPWQPEHWTVDPLKLACLLRLADATQIDSRRAPTFLFALRRPEGLSRDHWRFQEHVARPRLKGDRVTYTSWRPFDEKDAGAWWLALDYLRDVDRELKNVDALLFDLNRPRFEGRAVAGVDSPQRFSEHFPVRNWRPVDARIAVSDVPRLVETLGGEQLYGKQPDIALRELLQNAQDATAARKALDPQFKDDEVVVTLVETTGTWILEVVDRGVGMDEEILTSALLDFGRTGWSSDAVRNKFDGLVDGGFRPKGRFGVGFFAVFMLGDNVEVVTRRFDASPAEARKLKFRGVQTRPILNPIPAIERTPVGTQVRIELRINPFDTDGLFSKTPGDRLDELVQWICPEHSVAIRAVEPSQSNSTVLPPVDLRVASPADVFDILYPPVNWIGSLAKRQLDHIRASFVDRATEVLDECGRRIGLAAYGYDFYYSSRGRIEGSVLVNGFRSDLHPTFAGYLDGQPSRASRDKVELLATESQARDWLNFHTDHLRKSGLLDDARQSRMAHLYYRANRALPDDYAVALVSSGTIKLSEIAAWIEMRDEIVLVRGWPLVLRDRPLELYHLITGRIVELPEGWIYPMSAFLSAPFEDVFERCRDVDYEFARHHRDNTWQRAWWRTSDSIEGLVLKQICSTWGCEIGEILEPIESRDWDDFAELEPGYAGHVPVWRLNRPVRRT